jgi:hypothetical protein
MILKEIPDLEEALDKNPLEAARLLLDWAANAGDYDLTSRLAEKTTEELVSMPVSQIYYDIFLANQGAVYCSGLAIFYDKLLKLFGYNSFTLNFGDLRDNLTHVTVIVPQKQANGWQYYLFDPTFNATFHHRDSGGYATVGEMIDLGRSDGADNLIVRSGPLDKREYIVAEQEERKCQVLKYRSNGWLICGRPNFGIESYFEDWKARFFAQGYPAGKAGFLKLLAARVFHIGSSSNSEASRQFIAELQKRGIPYSRN